MIVSLILGRKGSKGFPGKNTLPIFGRPLAWYPMTTALNSPEIDKVYLSTDDPDLVSLAQGVSVETIDRPIELASDDALGEHAYIHGYEEILRRNPDQKLEFVVLMMCNAATITSRAISLGIKCLRENPESDSAVTVSRYNMWSPLRARKVNPEELLEPFVRFDAIGDPEKLNCDRDSQGDVWFADMGASVVRPHCLELLDEGMLPQKWMGRKIAPIYQEAGFDLDYEWQVPLVEWWLKTFWDGVI